MPALPVIIALLGQWLTRNLPSMMGVLWRMPLWISAVFIASGTFFASEALTSAALSGLQAVASSDPMVWCLATAFGIDAGLFWFIESLTIAMGIIVYMTIKQPLLDATSSFQRAML